ncbi:MAG TPA: hypothetical protein VLJ58_21585 [Ramlibacter sp.]|nr:hypothetical protein [Ramlibacter sp.]
MPFYRMPHPNGDPAGWMVHVRGSKNLPAPCAAVIEINGKQQHCRAISVALCDWPDGGGRTCSMPLCPEHRAHLGPDDLDFCPTHRADAEKANPGLFTGLTT